MVSEALVDTYTTSAYFVLKSCLEKTMNHVRVPGTNLEIMEREDLCFFDLKQDYCYSSKDLVSSIYSLL
jgi:hypothetical protein